MAPDLEVIAGLLRRRPVNWRPGLTYSACTLHDRSSTSPRMAEAHRQAFRLRLLAVREEALAEVGSVARATPAAVLSWQTSSTLRRSRSYSPKACGESANEWAPRLA